MELFIELAMSDKEAAYKKKRFLYVVGQRGREVHKTLAGESVLDIITAFENYCVPKQNETLECYKFFSHSQNAGESFDEYITFLHVRSMACNFGDLRDSNP